MKHTVDEVFDLLDGIKKELYRVNSRIDLVEKKVHRTNQILATMIADTMMGVGDFNEAEAKQKRRGRDN